MRFGLIAAVIIVTVYGVLEFAKPNEPIYCDDATGICATSADELRILLLKGEDYYGASNQ